MQTRGYVAGADRVHSGALCGRISSSHVCRLPNTRCLRGRLQRVGGLRPVACSHNEPTRHDDEILPRLGQEVVGMQAGSMGALTPDDSSDVLDFTSRLELRNPQIPAGTAMAGMATESPKDSHINGSPSRQKTGGFASIALQTADEHGWCDIHLFDVLQGAHIDAQSASHFFSQLAMRDSWLHPLSMEELLHAARIAGITGFALPPIVASQLQKMVQAVGPVDAKASADPLMAAFGYDLPALMDVLYGMEVRPSLAWTSYALRAWLEGSGGSGDGASRRGPVGSAAGSGSGYGPLTVASVRSVMVLLEALCVPDSEPGVEPPPMTLPPMPLMPYSATLVPSAATAAAPVAAHAGQWRSSLASAAPAGVGSSSSGSLTALPYGTSQVGQSYTAAQVREWLDTCIAALLDGGALARPHQREDVYGMLPHLATAPSATMFERLYREAPPPHGAAAAAAAAGGLGGRFSSSERATSPEHVAGLLWLLASSGAKLPPANVQAELRALEEALIRLASGPFSFSSSPFSLPNDDDSAFPRPQSAFGSSSSQSPTGTPDAAAAAAAAALNDAFALPSAQGAGGSSSPTPSPPLPASSFPSSFPSSFLPPSRPGSGLGSRGGPLSRLSAHGAYLCLWAFHHYHYTPHAATAPAVGSLLLSTALAGIRALGPRQRCRVLRAVLLCFDDTTQAELLAGSDWSPLFVGWETLTADELLPLLQDISSLACLRRHRRRQATRRHSRGGQGENEFTASAFAAAAAEKLGNRPGGGGGGSGRGAQLRLMHVTAHLLQLPGWTHRLTGLGLEQATASVSNLLEVLAADRDDDHDQEDENGEVAAAAQRSREGGSGAESGSEGPLGGFAQRLLKNWLTCVLPVIQDGVKQVTGDWGEPPKPAVEKQTPRYHYPHPLHNQQQQQQHQSSSPGSGLNVYGLYGNSSSSGGGTRGIQQPVKAAAGSFSAAATTAPKATSSSPVSDDDGGWEQPAWMVAQQAEEPQPVAAPLPPPVTATAGSASASAPPLTAAALVAVLTTLHGATAALDPRSNPAQHRTLMWALQRLGSRAGRCPLEPSSFAAVPDLLVKIDSMGWVDVPVEWADAIVWHNDTAATWFRDLSWPEALRAVLVSGQLVQRARAEVIRKHGVLTTTTKNSNSGHGTKKPFLFSSPSPFENGIQGFALYDNEPSVLASTSSDSSSSTAAELLAATTRLRNHLLGLLATRGSTCGPVDLRQLAVTWQAYGMPYDREAMTAVVDAMTAAAAAASKQQEEVDGNGKGGLGSSSSPASRPIWDAVQRLVSVCTANHAPRDEVERIFSTFRQHPDFTAAVGGAWPGHGQGAAGMWMWE